MLTVTAPATYTEYQKSQTLRLIDIPLGAFMMWFAYKSRGMCCVSRAVLFVAGLLTIIYNANNYFKNKAAN